MTVLTLHWRCWLRRNHHSNFITPMPQILGNKNRLCLTLHDELYIVDLSETLYFMADDHYTHVYYISDLHFMLPIGLARIEEGLEFLGVRHPHPFKRLGRKYIINALRILNINTRFLPYRPQPTRQRFSKCLRTYCVNFSSPSPTSLTTSSKNKNPHV